MRVAEGRKPFIFFIIYSAPIKCHFYNTKSDTIFSKRRRYTYKHSHYTICTGKSQQNFGVNTVTLSNRCPNKQRKQRRVMNSGTVRKLTIPQSASLTAPFAQGSRGQAKTYFLIFMRAPKPQKSILYFPTLEKNNRPCTFKPPLCKGRWRGAAVTEGLSYVALRIKVTYKTYKQTPQTTV